MRIGNLLKSLDKMNKSTGSFVKSREVRWDDMCWINSNDESVLYVKPTLSMGSMNHNGILEFVVSMQVGKETKTIIFVSDDNESIMTNFIVRFRCCDMRDVTILNRSKYGKELQVTINNCLHDETTIIDDSVKCVEYIDGLTIHQRNMINYCSEQYDLKFRMERYHSEHLKESGLIV